MATQSSMALTLLPGKLGNPLPSARAPAFKLLFYYPILHITFALTLVRLCVAWLA